jgi:hypothetical protein
MNSTIDKYFETLSYFTWILRICASIIILGTLLNIAIYVYFISLFYHKTFNASPYQAYNPLDILPYLLLPLLLLIVLYFWELIKNRGMIIFDEISDEIEWSHRTDRNLKEFPRNDVNSQRNDINSLILEKPPLDIRLKLRMFLSSTRLPLAPDRYGVSFYALIQLMYIILFTIIFLTKYS